MRAIRANLFLLFVAFSAAAAEPFTFEPPAPTTATSVLLRVETSWRDACLPHDPLVTRNGNTVDVFFRQIFPDGGGCILATTTWRTGVPLGMFEPGTYDVVLRYPDSSGGARTLATKTLVVAEFAPPVRMTPAFASTRGGSEVSFVFEFCKPITAIEIDGAVVPLTQSGCAVIGTLPPHAAGPVDVTIRSGESTTVVRSTLRYLDPAAAPETAIFERILVPVLVSGPGAFGSQWVTEAELHNTSTQPLVWLSDVARPPSCAPPCSVPPGTRIRLTSFGNNYPNGRILFVPREIANLVQLGGIVRDVSREQGYWGSELPFAREKDFRTGDIVLPNIPTDPRYRVQIRIYGLDGVSQVHRVTVRPGQVLGLSRDVAVSGPCTGAPCNSFEPAYGSVDLSEIWPPGSGPVNVIINSSSPSPAPAWAIVSITNNVTQHVTTVRPQ